MRNPFRPSSTIRRDPAAARPRRRRSFAGRAEGLEDRRLLTLTDVSDAAIALGSVRYGTNL